MLLHWNCLWQVQFYSEDGSGRSLRNAGALPDYISVALRPDCWSWPPLTGLHDCTQTHTLSRTPLEERSAHRGDLYLTHDTDDIHASRRDSNPQSQQASGRKPTPKTTRPQGPTDHTLYRVFQNECPTFKTLYLCNHEPQMNETCTTWKAVAYIFIWLPLDSTTNDQTKATVSWEDGTQRLGRYTLGPPRSPRHDTMWLFLMGIRKRTCLCSTITRWLGWTHKQNHGCSKLCDRRHFETGLGRIKPSRWCCPTAGGGYIEYL